MDRMRRLLEMHQEMMNGVGMMGGSSAMMDRPSGIMGGMMIGMMVHIGLTWVVMLALDVIFLYLVLSWGRSRHSGPRH
jgi:hypothetical protein